MARIQPDTVRPTMDVVDHPERERFEITVDGAVAGVAVYRRTPGQIAFLHTEVEDGHEGQGVGGALVRGALDAARAEGLDVLPFCPFVRDWLERHPEDLDLVPADRRADFRLPAG
jgi:predicted GNAT family acetyltransferase